MTSRKYKLKKRALDQAETRQRIVAATVHLHETIGVPGTTISEIARQAGVERLTVYRHFADDRALLSACTSHYLARHPAPDPAQWESIAAPEACLRTALDAIYAYHRETEAMMTTTYRDIESLPVLQEVLVGFFEYWQGIQDRLAAKYGGAGAAQPLLSAAIGHAIHFLTWRSLARDQGLSDDQAATLMVKFVGDAAALGMKDDQND